MRYRKLSADLDFTFGGGQRDFWRDVPEAVAQACQTRLMLWSGEWFRNLTEGTPYLQGILGKHSQQTANIVIQDRILGTQGCTGIIDFSSELDPNTRIMAPVDVSINTIYGRTDLEILNQRNF